MSRKRPPSFHTLCSQWGKWTCFFSAPTAWLSESVSRWAVAERCMQPQGFSIRLYSPVLQERPAVGTFLIKTPHWLMHTIWVLPATQESKLLCYPACFLKSSVAGRECLTCRTRHPLKQTSLPCWISRLWGTTASKTSQVCTEVYLHSSRPYSVNHRHPQAHVLRRGAKFRSKRSKVHK